MSNGDMEGKIKENNNNNIKKKGDLLKYLKEVHCKSEERTFDLYEKFNQIKDDLQKLIDNYNNDNTQTILENNDIDYSSIQDYISNYMVNERNNLINNINEIFYEINNNIEEISNSNNTNTEKIGEILLGLKKEFEKNFEEVVRHKLDIDSQKDEVNNKINEQMEEEITKIYDYIKEERENKDNNNIQKIIKIQNLLQTLAKNLKDEKIK